MSFEADGAKLSWELKSVNARGLEVRLRLPAGLEHLDSDIRATAREHLSRGSCFFTLSQENESAQPKLSLNEDALALVVAAARRLAAAEGIAMPTADGLLAIPGVLQGTGSAPSSQSEERRAAASLQAFSEAVQALKRAREEEGNRLGAILQDQLGTVERLVSQAEEIAQEAPDALRQRIREQVEMLTADGAGLDPDRLHQEAVLAATRADVREELDRLRSHVAGARDLLRSSDAVGRRLEFLTQEFNREANTLCSKAFDRRLTAVGVELKAVIDQFREQVQNVE